MFILIRVKGEISSYIKTPHLPADVLSIIYKCHSNITYLWMTSDVGNPLRKVSYLRRFTSSFHPSDKVRFSYSVSQRHLLVCWGPLTSQNTNNSPVNIILYVTSRWQHLGTKPGYGYKMDRNWIRFCYTISIYSYWTCWGTLYSMFSSQGPFYANSVYVKDSLR